MKSSLSALGLSVLSLFLVSSIVLAQETASKPASRPAVPEVVSQVVSDETVTVAKLSNGLTVIIKPQKAAPVVSVRAYVHTGAMYEKEWLGCGLSHLAEHLVANGEATEKSSGAAQKAMAQRVQKIGGQYNASTSNDWTNYYISAAASKALECVDLVSSWMARPEITREDFEREHGVVQRELEMGKDNPGRVLGQAHMDNMYGAHPAAVPVIGYPAPLRDLTWEDFQAYHKRMYVPSNMIFVVVGDVETAPILDRVRQDFAGFEDGRQPDHSLPEVATVLQTRRVALPMREIKETSEIISFQSIRLQNPDLYALDVLSTVLGEGPSSRLTRNVLREQKLVTAISSGSYTPSWGKGEFSINFRSQPDKAQAAEAAIIEQIKKIASEGVSEEELSRAKRQKAADLVEARQTVDSIAGTLASDYLSTGDVTFSANYVKKVQAVTAKQVQDAAVKYLQLDRMVVTRMVPTDKFAVNTAASQASQAVQAQAFTLPNGMKVVLHPVKGAGLVSMTLVTKGGLMMEKPENNGVGNLMMSLSTKGAGKLGADEIADFFEQAGGGISASCGNNTFTWQASVLEDSFDKALGIFADCVIRPTFDAKEIEILRPIAIAGIDKVEENWQSQMMRYFRNEFFKDCGPYQMLSSGNKQAIAQATGESLKAYHAKSLKAGDSVLAIFGEFDANAAKAQIEKLFAAVPEGKVQMPTCDGRKVDPAGETHVLKTKNQVAAIVVGLPGTTLDNLTDKFPIDVLDTIISGWQAPAGWLHDELRGKQLVYVVHAYNWPGVSPGAFITYAAGQPDKAPEIVSIIKKNLTKASQYTPTQAEINQAVNTILTAELLGNQSMGSLSMQAALDELWGFGADFHAKLEENYRKVTPEDVLRVGKKYLGQGTVVTVTTPKPELLEPTSAPAK